MQVGQRIEPRCPRASRRNREHRQTNVIRSVSQVSELRGDLADDEASHPAPLERTGITNMRNDANDDQHQWAMGRVIRGACCLTWRISTATRNGLQHMVMAGSTLDDHRDCSPGSPLDWLPSIVPCIRSRATAANHSTNNWRERRNYHICENPNLVEWRDALIRLPTNGGPTGEGRGDGGGWR